MNDIATKKVAIIVSNYFEESEFTEPLAALKTAGAQVEVISSAGKTLQALRHASQAGRYQADKLLDDIDPHVYDALILPGGAMNADVLRMEEKLHDMVGTFLQEGKIVAVICHAPWVLVSAGVVRGRKLTSYYTIQDDIRNAGGEWLDQEVVVDQSLITSRKPDDLPAFNKKIIEMLQETKLREA